MGEGETTESISDDGDSVLGETLASGGDLTQEGLFDEEQSLHHDSEEEHGKTALSRNDDDKEERGGQTAPAKSRDDEEKGGGVCEGGVAVEGLDIDSLVVESGEDIDITSEGENVFPGSDALSVASVDSTTTSYLHGENAGGVVTHLVHRSLVKKHKEQARRTRSRKTKDSAAAGWKGKGERKTNRTKLKASIDTDFF